ncbi:MAG: galactokinase [Pacificimonas sp.]|jgi:galactokinase|nr:galactokinase [Pacificimonas sp.]
MTVDPALIDRAVTAYEVGFGAAPDRLVYAPGRVNLIGEHTDYNDGFCLPVAIGYGTLIASGAGHNGTVDVVAADYGDQRDRFSLDQPIAQREDASWTGYVRGIAQVMQCGPGSIKPCRLAIAGNVPQGAGLSSSASLGVALARTFAPAEPDGAVLARIAQRAENEFVGVNCGIMDQLVSAKAQADHALLLDCRSFQTRLITIPASLGILVIHSGIRRGLTGSAYNERRAQCEAAARHYGVAALRDLSFETLENARGALPDKPFRRARHVVSENARVLSAAEALQNGDLAAIRDLFAASHQSMRNDFEITVPGIDTLVKIIARAVGSEGGARMTGGGFGGCVVCVASHDGIAAAIRATRRDYRTPAGDAPLMFEVAAAAGVRELAI